jgi:hypothetical protein
MAKPKGNRGTRITVRVAKQPDTSATLARYGASAGFRARYSGKSTTDLLSKAIANFSAVWSGAASASRYSDGTFNVLYTATKIAVAKAERCYWAVELVFKKRLASKIPAFMIYSCDVSGKYVNYTKGWKSKKALVHPKQYDYCHSLSTRARADGLDYLIVPSARKFGGCCVPILEERASKVRSALQSFDLCWDAKKRLPYVDDGTRRKYVTIDKVYEML